MRRRDIYLGTLANISVVGRRCGSILYTDLTNIDDSTEVWLNCRLVFPSSPRRWAYSGEGYSCFLRLHVTDALPGTCQASNSVECGFDHKRQGAAELPAAPPVTRLRKPRLARLNDIPNIPSILIQPVTVRFCHQETWNPRFVPATSWGGIEGASHKQEKLPVCRL